MVTNTIEPANRIAELSLELSELLVEIAAADGDPSADVLLPRVVELQRERLLLREGQL